MGMKSGSKAEASSELPTEGDSAPDEAAIEFERLRRSLRVVNTLLRSIADSRKLLTQLASPFLETPTEKDSQKKISERHRRRRDAVFAAAKDALDPEHPIKKSVDESLATLEPVDVAIASNVRDVKSKVLEQLDDLINHALSDANSEKSAESVEQFAGKVQTLLAEMDVHTQELRIVQKMCKTQLRQAWIARLTTTRNILIASALLISVAIVAVGYVVKARKHAEEVYAAAHPPPNAESVKTESVTVPPKTDSVPDKPVSATGAPGSGAVVTPNPATVVANPVPNNIADAEQAPKQTQNPQSVTKIVNGTATLTTGQNPEAIKKSVQALGEAIKEWNAENGMRAAPDKTKKKDTK